MTRSERRSVKQIAVSVCIVTYNTKEFLEKCLLSIRSSTKVAHEIIVVDNNSSDGTRALLKQIFPDVKSIFNEENKGFAKAANQAVKLAVGNYVLILNPDTEVLTDAIDRCFEFIKTKSEKDLVTCKIINSDGSVQKIKKSKQFYSLKTQLFMHSNLDRFFPNHHLVRDARLRHIDYNQLQVIDYAEGCFMMMKREFFETIGLFDEEYFLYSEDCDLCRRVAEHGGKIYYYPEATIIHHGGESTKQDSLEAHHQFVLNRYKFYEKQFGADSARKFRSIIMLGSLIKITKSIFRAMVLKGCDTKYLLKRDADTFLWSLGLKRFEPFIN